MKLAASLIATTFASHFRGGSYQVEDQGANLKVTYTNNWRQDSAGFGSRCDQNELMTVAPYDVETAECYTSNGDWCGDYDLFMKLLFAGDNFCYGDAEVIMPKPSGPFEFGWDSCCWVRFTDDNGGSHSSGDMEQWMTVNVVDNNTPTYKLPSNAMVMSGCTGMDTNVSVQDADGDKFKCRWATYSEAGGAYNGGKYPSLVLDEDTCTVTYNGSGDATSNGVKAVALMLEDFDAQGNVKSSVPIQYLIQVWTPSISRSNKFRGYPDVFGDDDSDHQDHVDNTPVRGRRSTPTYCNALPEYIAPTPTAGSKLTATQGYIQFDLKASSGNGAITKYEYTPPAGLTCSKVKNDAVTCTWQMTAEQMFQTSSFCYQAVDAAGLKAPSQCLTIDSTIEIDSIGIMAKKLLDGSGANGFTFNDAKNYGCVGRGTFDAFTGNAGKPIEGDAVDTAFNQWKHCVRCAAGNKKGVEAYSYDQANNSCANSSNSSRGVCECDKALVNALYDAKTTNSNYSSSSCSTGNGGGGSGSASYDCCNWNNHFWAQFNMNTHCCGQDGVKEIGSC